MGWLSKTRDATVGTPEARKNLKAKRANLKQVSDREVTKNGGKPISEASAAYSEANRGVLDAEKKLPFWGRW